ncbi:MAG: hypothetical protein IJ716_16650 [Lachnospiraceae bacterium]|nr:hypothetical protein [Lachnospiraceae bacterium]
MKVNHNTTIFMGDEAARARHGAGAGQENGGVRSGSAKSVDASGLKAVFDPVAQKKAQAQKQALKLVGDVFANDRKMDQDLEGRRERIRQLQQENGEYRRSIQDIENNREEFRKNSGVAADSDEERELQLLAKEKEASFAGSSVRLSDEEREEIARIKEKGLTQYQQDSLAMKEDERYFAEAIHKGEQEIETENATITGTKIERLKTHAMTDAQKEAEQIMQKASGDIVNLLVGEAKDHIEEELEEKKETAKEEAEKREELQEKVDAAKERKKEQEEFTEEILEATRGQGTGAAGMNEAQQEIKDMMNKMKLIEEDIKGAAVDRNV